MQKLNSTDFSYFLKSERVGFRWWQDDDLLQAIELWGNPQVTRLFNKEPLTETQIAERLKKEIETARTHQIQYWPIFSLADGKHIGCAGLRPHRGETLELGFHLKPEYWGKGLATEVGRSVIEHAFASGLTHAIFAGHHPDNKPSRNTLIKLGFLGTSAQFYEPTGLFHPSYLLYLDRQPFATRPVLDSDARALALVHSNSIHATFGGILDKYVQARSLDYCEERWEKRLAKKECQTLVLTCGEQVVGFASVAASPDQDLAGRAGEVDRIYIHSSAWGHGQGMVLMDWCEKALVSQGYKTLSLWVFEVNERARRFYEKRGFRPDGCCKHDFDAKLLRYTRQV